ncbi:MAG: glycosyltransferase family 2 protein [Firmicutes bacterium]|nr:glycosyltransferase family 2 protein [Bacillota bacterium]
MSTVIAAVIPSQNEILTIPKVLNSLKQVPVDIIIPVINGTTDGSLEFIRKLKGEQLYPVCFPEPLGIDVPRAIGAKIARDLKAFMVIFIDGDMSGDIGQNIKQLVESVLEDRLDLALTDCYPHSHPRYISPLAAKVLEFRKNLNIELSLGHLGTASPSHGPHAISRRLLELTPVEYFALPPTLLVIAVQKDLKIGIGTSVAHSALGSQLKTSLHSSLIADTIVGDCIEASQLFKGLTRHRCRENNKYIGYHSTRRWDLLAKFLEHRIKTDCN